MPQIFTVGQPKTAITPFGSGQRTRLLTLDFKVDKRVAIFISANADVWMDRHAIPGSPVPPGVSGFLQVGYFTSGQPVGTFSAYTEHRVDLSVAADTWVMINLPLHVTHTSPEVALGSFQAALDFYCINVAPSQIMPRRLTAMLLEW